MATSLSIPCPTSSPLPALPAGFLRHHLAWPLVAGLLASVVLVQGGGDLRLADALFRIQGGHWALREHWLTSGVIHHGGKWASMLAALAVLGVYLSALRHAHRARLRRPLLYLVLAIALDSSSVSLLKSLTNVDCPWDLVRYGGTRAAVGLFAARPAGMPHAACFPAGHASAGYAWVALYFAALLWQPRWRWHGLAIGLGAGLLFGGGQQLRGAHFLSHDVSALALCWFLSLGLFVLLQRHPCRSIGHAAMAMSG